MDLFPLQIIFSGQSEGQALGRVATLSQSSFLSLSRSVSGLLFHRTISVCYSQVLVFFREYLVSTATGVIGWFTMSIADVD